MIRILAPLAFTAAITLPLTAAVERPAEGLLQDGFITNIDALIGMRVLDNDWRDVGPNELPGFGVQFQTIGLKWPVGVQVGASFAQKNGNNVDLNHHEYWLGAFKPWRFGEAFSVEAGGGISAFEVKARIKNVDRRERITGVGAYVQGGVRYTLQDAVDFGIMLRYGYGQVDTEVAGKDVNPIGGMLMASVGLRF